jgi:type I restriction enzyme M protein
VIARNKPNLDITWLRDDTLDDASTLPPPAVLAAAIVKVEGALAQFTELARTLPTLADAAPELG